jgi:hypothetical protein
LRSRRTTASASSGAPGERERRRAAQLRLVCGCGAHHAARRCERGALIAEERVGLRRLGGVTGRNLRKALRRRRRDRFCIETAGLGHSAGKRRHLRARAGYVEPH